MNHKIVAIPHSKNCLTVGRVTIPNFSLEIFKSKVDQKMFLQILNSTEAELHKLLATHPNQIKISESEKNLEKDGRTVYLKLNKPITIDGQTLTYLRFKGVRPRVTATGSVEPYVKGGGFVDRILKIDISGNLYVAINDGTHPELRTNPTGTMFTDHAHTEFEIMKNAQEKGYSTDYAFCEGTYTDMHLNNESVGFVVCGMTSEDIRITIQKIKIDEDTSIRKPFLNNTVNNKWKELNENEVNNLYQEIGKTFRAYNDDGKYHLYPHAMNIGVIQKNETFDVLLRDLNTSAKRDNFQGAPLAKAKQEATARFLDLSRLIYDLSVVDTYTVIYDGEEGDPIDIDARRFIKPLLAGYFPELAKNNPDAFAKLIEFCNNPNFNVRIANLVGRDSKILNSETMDSSNKFFGKLWEQLYSLSNTPTEPTVATE